MGTRNLTIVVDELGYAMVAQYGQWDGYPSSTGVGILDFISDKSNLDYLKAGLHLTHFITDEAVDKIYQEVLHRAGDEAFKESYPSLTRDIGWQVIEVIRDKVFVPLVNSIDFAEDTLMCEGIYTINYQTKEFISVYDGKTVVYSFDALPTPEVYLESFEKDLTNA